MSKSIKLPHFVVREVRRAVLSAKLAMHLCRCAVERGDLESARQYRIEAREKLVRARFFVGMSTDQLAAHGHDRVEEVFDFFFPDFNFSVFPKLPADKPAEIAKNDSATEQVSVPAASAELPVFVVRDRALFYTHVYKLHSRKWCPFLVDMAFARGELPSSWPPLPGKRPLVGGQGEVRLSSVQAST